MTVQCAGSIVLVALTIGAVVLVRRVRNHVTGRHVPGGILMADAATYDTLTCILSGSYFRRIASDIAGVASPAADVLEVGCGPVHLSIRLARDHDLDVTGLDLDPAMVERARANAKRSSKTEGRQLRFVVGDVSELPFDDASFDLVVSTFSMHHWSEPKAGLHEIARVLRPGGRALIWDLKAGFRPFHAHTQAPAPTEQAHAGPLRIVSIRPWQWPWRLTISQRLELARG